MTEPRIERGPPGDGALSLATRGLATGAGDGRGAETLAAPVGNHSSRVLVIVGFVLWHRGTWGETDSRRSPCGCAALARLSSGERARRSVPVVSPSLRRHPSGSVTLASRHRAGPLFPRGALSVLLSGELWGPHIDQTPISNIARHRGREGRKDKRPAAPGDPRCLDAQAHARPTRSAPVTPTSKSSELGADTSGLTIIPVYALPPARAPLRASASAAPERPSRISGSPCSRNRPDRSNTGSRR